MGLDIFVKRVKKSVYDEFNGDYQGIVDELNKQAKNSYIKITNRLVKQLEKDFEVCSPIEYANKYMEFVLKLQKNVPLYNVYDYKLCKFGYDSYKKELGKILEPNQVVEVISKEHPFCVYQAYFRKVNFLYRYFSDRLENECCFVDKSVIEELISTCEDVLAHKGDEDYAAEHLPTTSGFFFGSTAYDEWYWKDVKSCIKQMKKLIKPLKDEDYVLWEFSW